MIIATYMLDAILNWWEWENIFFNFILILDTLADDNTELDIRWKSKLQIKFTPKENVQ